MAELVYREGMNYGEMVDAMVKVGSDEEKAKVFFESYVEGLMTAAKPTRTREAACSLVSANLGYLSGYAPDSIDSAMWERVGAVHPVFGAGWNLRQRADGVETPK